MWGLLGLVGLQSPLSTLPLPFNTKYSLRVVVTVLQCSSAVLQTAYIFLQFFSLLQGIHSFGVITFELFRLLLKYLEYLALLMLKPGHLLSLII